MNKQRRKALAEVLEKIEVARALLEDIAGEEEDYKDNIPENLQTSDRFLQAENACTNMVEAGEALEDVICKLEEAME